MPERYRIIGTASANLSEEGFRDLARAALDEFAADGVDEGTWSEFAPNSVHVLMTGLPMIYDVTGERASSVTTPLC